MAMPLTFNDDGDVRAVETKVADWQAARDVAPTAADYAGTYLAHADAELTCSVQRGRLVVETAPSAKGALNAQRGSALHAHVRLECELPLDVLVSLSAILIERVAAAKRLAGA